MLVQTPNYFSNQWRLFVIATIFLTRIPLKLSGTVSESEISNASRYFPLVGLLIGTIASLTLLLFSVVLPVEISVLLSLVVSLFITGCFHEDGLADTADGFGGGWDADKKLAIMKDSRLGTYGVSALTVALGLKYVCLFWLAELSLELAVIALLTAHTLSRFLSLSLAYSLNYVQEQQASKTKPVAQNISLSGLVFMFISSLMVLGALTFFVAVPVMWWVVITLVLFGVRQWLIYFFKQQIGGYCGDALGAAQQVFELSCYLLIITLVGW